MRYGLALERLDSNAIGEEVVQSADHPAHIIAEAQAVSVNHPQHRRRPHEEEAVHRGGTDVLGTGEPAIEYGQTRRHDQHQCGTSHHESRIGSVHV